MTDIQFLIILISGTVTIGTIALALDIAFWKNGRK